MDDTAPGSGTDLSVASHNAHEHDWRVNPNVVLLSNPPQSELVCAGCGARSSRSAGRATSTNPADWPRV